MYIVHNTCILFFYCYFFLLCILFLAYSFTKKYRRWMDHCPIKTYNFVGGPQKKLGRDVVRIFNTTQATEPNKT